MRASNVKAQIELEGQEIRDIAYHIFGSLKQSIESHYVQTSHDHYKRGYEGHAKPLFYEQCGSDVRLMNEFLALTGEGSNRLEEELISFFKTKYIEKNKSLTLEDEKENK